VTHEFGYGVIFVTDAGRDAGEGPAKARLAFAGRTPV